MPDQTQEAQPNTLPSPLRQIVTAALLILVLVLSALLRYVGRDWDEGNLLHPDERFMAMVVSSTHLEVTESEEDLYDLRSIDSIGAYFDTLHSPLNPNNVGHGFFVYGNLPITLTRLLGERLEKTAIYDVYMVGRDLSMIADLITIVFVFLAARTLFDWRAGILAAALYGGSALPIQQSHFFTVDTLTTMFVSIAFFFAARLFQKHRWPDYVLFGLALGAAMSSKLSVYPFALILILALAVRVVRESRQVVPTHEGEPAGKALRPIILRAAIGLVIAGAVTTLTFRVGQPYAFLPPGTDVPIDEAQLGTGLTLISRIAEPFGFRPNPAWIDQMRAVRVQVTGHSDIPPNHQWGHRTPLLFPWVNMVEQGLGWPVGIFAWLSFLWALWEIFRRHRGSLALIVSAAWVALFFTLQGSGWVTTMRYFMPMYPALLMLAGWALITLWDRVSGLLRTRSAPRWHWAKLAGAGIMAAVLVSSFAWGFAVSRIYTRPHTRIAASRWIVENVPADVTLFIETEDGPRQVQVGIINNWPQLDDSQPQSPTAPIAQYSYLNAGTVQPVIFTMPFDGTLTGIRINHLIDPLGRPEEKILTLTLTGEDAQSSAQAIQTAITGTFAAESDPRGEAYDLTVAPMEMTEDERYTLTLQADLSGPLVLAGSSIATEGSWDDPVPQRVPPYDVWGALYQPYELELVWEDSPDKQARMQFILDHTDYLTISSNRFYDTLSRNPDRWPMTIDYYEALFGGELGFELVGDFASRPTLGPIMFNDDRAEEAWTVYDHPRVFIFRKTADYSPENTAAILGQADLDQTVKLTARYAKGRPVRIKLPPPRRYEDAVINDVWFSSGIEDSATPPGEFYVRVQPLTVILWWVVIALIGWLGFPTLWAIFPGLKDRGYALARIFGLLFSAWLAWMFASVNALPWNGGTILVALLVLACISTALIFPRRHAFISWLKANRRHILIIEGGLLALYLIFIFIRLGNPDLWHPVFGGEKPMDLAYFNAVLNSSTFPPYNPWMAGTTQNYYYFGFVVVGLPVKLLGIPSTLAYNLILPTLFALTGAGAFSAAYNLAAGKPDASEEGGRQRWQPYAAGLAALLLAIILGNLDQLRTALWGLAELGHGAPEWAVSALPDLGDLIRGIGLAFQGNRLPVGAHEWYWNATRLIPVPISPEGLALETGPITEFPAFTFLYADLHAHMMAFPITLFVVNWAVAFIRGAGLRSEDRPVLGTGHLALSVLVGALGIGALQATNTWDYPTYLALGVGAAAIGIFIRRESEDAFLALGVGGLTALSLGALFFLVGANPTPDGSTNSTALILAGLGLLLGIIIGFAFGLAITRRFRAQSESRDDLYHWLTVIMAVGVAGLLAALTVVFFQPYIQNYEAGYTTIIRWEGSHTPVWALLDILGLFLFIILTWLAVELRRWLRLATRKHFIPILLAVGLLIAATIAGVKLISPVAWVAIPVIFIALALFFKPGQEGGKRLVLIMLTGALALTLFVELFVLEGDIHRMNTVFKFYLQVWLLMAVTAGAAFGWLWPALRKAHRPLAGMWWAGLATLVFLAALYPLMAARAKIADRWNPSAPTTLDGMAYMPTVARFENGGEYDLDEDYEAIRWLQANVEGTPVVLEAVSAAEYMWGSRISIYTGLPSVAGWSWHQRQQRPPFAPEVLARHMDVRAAYDTPSIPEAQAILDRYDVELIMVGGLERLYYDPVGLAKFEAMAEDGLLEALFTYNETTIYRVVREVGQ